MRSGTSQGGRVIGSESFDFFLVHLEINLEIADDRTHGRPPADGPRATPK